MQIIGVDLHTRQQTVAMLNVETGEIVEKTLRHEGDAVREFYSTLAGPTRVGIEATGSMQWFLELMEELGIDSRHLVDQPNGGPHCNRCMGISRFGRATHPGVGPRRKLSWVSRSGS